MNCVALKGIDVATTRNASIVHIVYIACSCVYTIKISLISALFLFSFVLCGCARMCLCVITIACIIVRFQSIVELFA